MTGEQSQAAPNFAMPDAMWQELKAKYEMSDRQIVDLFVRPFIAEIVTRGAVAFLENPTQFPERSLLGEQWRILRDEFDYVFDAGTMQAVPRTRADVERLL